MIYLQYGCKTHLIEKYNIEYMKFDFNANLAYDKKREAFYHYHKGYTKFINAVRSRYPDIYIECCASGGYRMELENLKRFDSFWFSDNQSPYEGLQTSEEKQIFRDFIENFKTEEAFGKMHRAEFCVTERILLC